MTAINSDKPFEPRQAVVLVHGIGSQRPMATLRRFVESLLAGFDLEDPAYFSKPDRFESTRELRRLYVPASYVFGIDTDFYEFYWAHLMKGTTWSHIVGWLKALVLRRPWTSGWGFFFLWALAVSLLGVAAWAFLEFDLSSVLAGSSVVLALSLSALAGLSLGVVGDAARYLSNSPANVEVRSNIRNAGVELFSALNRDEHARYDRLVVVGHSLGSLIAYDVLSHLWQAEHVPPGLPAVGSVAPEDDLTGMLASGVGSADWAAAQKSLRRRARELGIRWRVTDLVTMGSPLTHASWLIGKSKAELSQLVAQRELPSCPPTAADPRDKRLVRQPMDDEGNAVGGRIRVLHHGAVFALTRWTNLHCSRWRDPVGGPINAPLGDFVKNVRVTQSTWARWVPLPLVAHSRYWLESSGVDALRGVLAAGPPGPDEPTA